MKHSVTLNNTLQAFLSLKQLSYCCILTLEHKKEGSKAFKIVTRYALKVEIYDDVIYKSRLKACFSFYRLFMKGKLCIFYGDFYKKVDFLNRNAHNFITLELPNLHERQIQDTIPALSFLKDINQFSLFLCLLW